MNALVQFYRGTHSDDQSRLLADILRQDDDWLERTHDEIKGSVSIDIVVALFHFNRH